MTKPLLRLSKRANKLHGNILLPSSKSESNRMLIISSMAVEPIRLYRLSSARDTQTMIRLLDSTAYELHVGDAGTTMRFLVAFMALRGRACRLTGNARMQERPIGILVEALQQIGVDIRYEKKKGYPPILIEGFRVQKTNEITIRGDVSSQFISALMMTAPRLSEGLTIHLEGKLGSRPYLELTAALMGKFGISPLWDGNTLHIPQGRYHCGSHEVESDWSGAGYWFGMASLTDEVDLYLKGLRSDSLQADKKAVEIYAGLGVQCRFDERGLHLSKTNAPTQASAFIDFSDCPDLAQTVAVSYAALGLDCTFTGLESLRVKETDRIEALQQELAKIGAKLIEKEEGQWLLFGAKELPEHVTIRTYDDHRMAMAFAPLMYRMHVDISEPMVVAKSYPEFWDHLGVSLS